MAKRLWELFYTFAKVGVMTFGGGYAMLPILQREVVENKGWATEEELADWFSIGQCTPGVIAVNTATFAGRKVLGNVGGVVATSASCFPRSLLYPSSPALSRPLPRSRGSGTPSRASVCACAC